MKRGILVCGHGSRKQEGIKGLVDFTRAIQMSKPDYIVNCCFLDLSDPDFSTSVAQLYNQGVREIIAAPAFLFGGIHANFALPNKIEACKNIYPDLKITLVKYIGINEPLLKACSQNVTQVENSADISMRGDHCLLTVGAGASVSSANGDVAKLTRMIWENCGFGFAQYSFVSRITFPSVDTMLLHLGKMDFKRIVILPILFFPGVYIDKIYLAIEQFRLVSDVEVLVAEPLGNNSLLVDAIIQRISEAE